MPAYFDDYFKALQSTPVEEITEHSHRTALENLLNAIANKQKHKLQILHEPKRTAGFGAPDFKISSAGSIVGYVENKKIEEKLSKIFKSDQIKKYKALNDNILLTNYIEFVWLKGDDIKNETLCSELDLQKRKAKLQPERIAAVEALISKFFSQPPTEIGSGKKLAEALAVRAKYLKEFLKEELDHQKEDGKADKLMGLYETFKEFVFHELTIDEFADAFAQNLAYGLFLAKLNADTKQVTLLNAKEFIPHSFELIKELVDFLDELKNTRYNSTKWIVEEVLTIMNHLDLREIQRSLFYRSSKSTDLFGETDYGFKDPFIYFYEYFLAVYDKKLRKSKGVYYTPPPIVNFIVRAIDDVLQKEFDIKDGLADMNKVTVLDFATGTGTFLVDIIQRILEKAPANTAKRRQLVKDHILKNLYGFEYLIAPYTIAHLKLSQYLKDAGYPLENEERLQVYLTNTLEPIDKQIKMPLLPALSHETKEAQKVKDKPILVITGNPPYSYVSKNNGTWINTKIQDYFFVDGKKLQERNPKGLQDDYVKFIRFAQDKMDKEDEGIVGIITNHSFLDNPTFRGMRQSLMKTFDQMYFVNLHGNNKKKEKSPDGSRDENVFDIEQGVAISILIKKKGLEKKIYHSDFWGTRKEKYKQSWELSLKDINWKSNILFPPFYLFTNGDQSLREKYEKGFLIFEIFKVHGVGVATSRDNLCVQFSKDELKRVIKNFVSISDEAAKEKYQLGPDVIDWKVSLAKKDLLESNLDENKIIDYLYRPFDIRFTFYTGKTGGFHSRPRKEVMKHLLKNNIALFVGRQGQALGSETWNLIFCGNMIEDYNLFRRGNNACLPLYFYEEVDKYEPNFNKPFFDNIKLFNKSLTPEQILGYIYAILHSPTYRTKYAEFLKIDFPRIPFTEDKEMFQQLSDLGWQLVQAHLMNHDTLNEIPGEVHCTDNGDFEVEKVVFNTNKLFINTKQYFYPVSSEVYEFYIGGYQVLNKYLKDRKGRKLSLTETGHVTNIIKVLGFTIEQMKKIDELTEKWI